MVGRTVCVLAVIAAAAIGCSSAAGADKNEGSSCTQNGDCGGNLTCQPITGRQGDFCCPTPPDSSSEGNCHAAK